ncbi:glutathione S-transferase theta-3 isoform X3 [Harpegnathos saltator]|uniref:glutathione S-transferase theta-3 isoform X3 n=1 Tax=Harpegnathos saltator TaxID=610380 RepID=UPI00058BD15B|nr:glutathione S-transferase theta-3 isoform X3 [Harpegnathos saltator]
MQSHPLSYLERINLFCFVISTLETVECVEGFKVHVRNTKDGANIIFGYLLLSIIVKLAAVALTGPVANKSVVCNLPFERNIINLKNLEQLTPEYEKINPMKKVPVIDHNGFKLAESVGIVRYISREFKVDDRWYPSDSKLQAKVDEYLEWQHLNTRLHAATYFLIQFLLPLIKGRAPKAEKVAESEKRLNDCLDLIENVWLKDKLFLTGNTITVADIFGTCEIEQTRLAGYDPQKERPNLTAWMERVAKETSPHYQEAHKFLNLLIKQAGEKTSKI